MYHSWFLALPPLCLSHKTRSSPGFPWPPLMSIILPFNSLTIWNSRLNFKENKSVFRNNIPVIFSLLYGIQDKHAYQIIWKGEGKNLPFMFQTFSHVLPANGRLNGHWFELPTQLLGNELTYIRCLGTRWSSCLHLFLFFYADCDWQTCNGQRVDCQAVLARCTMGAQSRLQNAGNIDRRFHNLFPNRFYSQLVVYLIK